MRNKRLIILIAVLGGIAAIVIIMSAVFTIYNTDAACATDYGDDNSLYPTILEVNEEVKAVADEFRYQNIFLFDEQAVIDAVNARVPRAEAYDIECVFPNKIIVRYNLVSEDLQFAVDGGWAVAGISGKILAVNSYDRTDPDGGHYSDTIISVTPSAAPDGGAAGEYVFSNRDCADMTSLRVIVGLAESLYDGSGLRAFEKSAYASVDLSDQDLFIIRMRSGLTVRIMIGGHEDMLADFVYNMISWYTAASDADISRGTLTVHYSASADQHVNVSYNPNT